MKTFNVAMKYLMMISEETVFDATSDTWMKERIRKLFTHQAPSVPRIIK